MQPSNLRLSETPEGIELELRVAGPVARGLAWLIDSLIRLAMLLALAPLLTLADLGIGLLLLAAFVLEWWYPVLFEVARGATPGKQLFGLAVVHDDGSPVGLAASTLRNLLRVVDFLPVLYAAGLVCCLLDRDFRRLGDLVAGTLVVHRAPIGRGGPAGVVTDAHAERPPGDLSAETRWALLAFAERAPGLSAARRAELAEILTAREGLLGEAAVARVVGWGAWLARGHPGGTN